jgi:hypothetical protein
MNINAYLRKFIKMTVQVIFEKSKTANEQYGISQYFFKVYVNTNRTLTKQMHLVKIDKIIEGKVYGHLLDK